MSNFYREFTKDLQRRLNSRAYDIKPQEVVSNQVQLVSDIERPFVRKIVCGLQQSFSHDPLIQSDWQYGQTLAAINVSINTPLGYIGVPGSPNPPLFIFTDDDIDYIEVDQFRYNVELFNGSGAPTAVSHTIQFLIQMNGVTVNSADTFLTHGVGGTLAAGAALAMNNRGLPYNTNQPQNVSNRALPLILSAERITSSTTSQSPAAVENQITWIARHFHAGVETQTLTFSVRAFFNLSIYYKTPYSQIQENRLATLQP
jgi:hypothetical protein